MFALKIKQNSMFYINKCYYFSILLYVHDISNYLLSSIQNLKTLKHRFPCKTNAFNRSIVLHIGIVSGTIYTLFLFHTIIKRKKKDFIVLASSLTWTYTSMDPSSELDHAKVVDLKLLIIDLS